MIEKHICVAGECITVDDGAHTIYVNGAKQGSETELAKRIDNALEMTKNGKLTLEEVSQCSGLSLEKVRELAEGKTA